MFSSSLEIFSTFNIHHPVYGCVIYLHFNLTESTIVNHRFGLSIQSNRQTPSSGEKNYKTI